MHDRLVEVLKHLSFKNDQIVYIKKQAENRFTEANEHCVKETEAKNKQLQEVEKKIERLEERLMNDELEAPTYK